MTDHDYAGCQDLVCRRCDDYSSAGYRDGKAKALFEVSSRTVDHPRGCGCDPVPGGGGTTSPSRRC